MLLASTCSGSELRSFNFAWCLGGHYTPGSFDNSWRDVPWLSSIIKWGCSSNFGARSNFSHGCTWIAIVAPPRALKESSDFADNLTVVVSAKDLKIGLCQSHTVACRYD
jgi:hypothetical protein